MQSNIAYLRKEWTLKEIDAFILKVELVIELIKKQPEMYSPSKKVGVRRVKINKKIDLYYRYFPILEEIHLLTFWNVKRNPSDLSL